MFVPCQHSPWCRLQGIWLVCERESGRVRNYRMVERSMRMANAGAVACRAIMVTGLSARAAFSLPCLLVNGLLNGGDSSRLETR